MSNELTEEQIEKIWNLNRAPTHVRWHELHHAEKEAAYASMLHGAYTLGRESVEPTGQGWTDLELQRVIDGATDTIELVTPAVKSVRAILAALGIDHEPPVPEPGSRYVTMNGDLAFVNPAGRLIVVEKDGAMMVRADDESWPHLTPARVVEGGEA